MSRQCTRERVLAVDGEARITRNKTIRVDAKVAANLSYLCISVYIYILLNAYIHVRRDNLVTARHCRHYPSRTLRARALGLAVGGSVDRVGGGEKDVGNGLAENVSYEHGFSLN